MNLLSEKKTVNRNKYWAESESCTNCLIVLPKIFLALPFYFPNYLRTIPINLEGIKDCTSSSAFSSVFESG